MDASAAEEKRLVDAAGAAEVFNCPIGLWNDWAHRALTPPDSAGRWLLEDLERWGAQEISGEHAAALAGITPGTFRSYVWRGQAPPAVRHYGRTPVWVRRSIVTWMATRPGRGARTDLHARRR